MDAATLIERLGGTTAVARRLNEPVSTVQSWKTKNSIPRWRLPSVQALLTAPESEQATGQSQAA